MRHPDRPEVPAHAFLSAAFFEAAFLAGAFLAAVFFAAFLAGAFFAAAFFFTGPRARRSASSSEARASVMDSTSSPLRRLALVSPSVTYGPNRPSLITIGFSLTESTPSSRNGGVAAA
ncbi:hypothetical protein SAMN04490220_0015 [Rhodococcus jostii]|uniref:Uncharacterized protein n=1 Tax=Rhodococcus jostii TaxID=132919 RepID=A0A1H4IES1_RHOJO|nr:hypothetical protein SAMN04490220_0015 [Rhodococcus jostii]